ncbi:MAG TPA: aminodeoxychorismate synthase, component I, partial [Candidatus Paceibacterota bacterium]|nr:aminodeoxychorismate synthase, component I [Candidatus Paceibacterota bacterium]
MRPLLQEITTTLSPEHLVERLHDESGVILLRSVSPAGVSLSEGFPEAMQARYSFVTARPFQTFRSFGSRCEVASHVSRITHHEHFGNPWHLLDSLMARYELLEEPDLPFPLGGCFGYWGYDLKNFVEP